MALYCTRCGKRCLENSIVCPMCGQRLIKVQTKSALTKSHPKGFILSPNKNVGIVMLVLLSIMVLFVIVLLFSKKPDEKWIEEIIPSDMYVYNFEGENFWSTVKDVKIESNSKRNGFLFTECKVELEGDMIDRTFSCRVVSEKIGLNEWMLVSWETLEMTQMKISEEYSKNRAYDYMTDLGYVITEENTSMCNVSEFAIFCEYDIDLQFDYYWAKGLVTYDGYLEFDNVMEFPQRFDWVDSMDDSGLDYGWKLAGIWEGESDGYRYEMEITEIDSNTYQWWARCYYDTDREGEKYYSNEGTFSYNKPVCSLSPDPSVKKRKEYKSPRDAMIFYAYWCDYPWCEVTFYPTEAEIAIGRGTKESNLNYIGTND